MNVESLQMISKLFFVLAGVLFIVSAVLFQVLKISRVIGELTGATARKEINSIREQSMASDSQSYRASFANYTQGRITDELEMPTVPMFTAMSVPPAPSEETVLLAPNSVLVPHPTVTPMPTAPMFTPIPTAPTYSAMSVPSAPSEETVLLTPNSMPMPNSVFSSDIEVEYEIGFTESAEIIK